MSAPSLEPQSAVESAPAPGSSVELVLLLCPRRLDQFMHDADMFEPFKRLVVTDEGGNPSASFVTVMLNHDRPDYERIISIVREGVEMNRELDFRVLACFSPGRPGGWRDPTCNVISTGLRWMLLDKELAKLGFVAGEAPQTCG